MATDTVPMDDKDLMASALADEPTQETAPAPEAPPEQTPEAPREDATGRLHGEGGRFVAKPTDTPAAATQQPAEQQPAPQPINDDNAAQVPSWRLREVREAREAAERRADETARQAHAYQQQLQDMQRQLAELRRPKPEPVNFFDDPDAALRQRVEPLQADVDQRFNEFRLDMSRELAIVRHGEQAVSEMETAIAQAMQQGHPDMPALRAQMQASKFPALVAMQWHQREKTQREIGGDLNAYNVKLQEKLLADPEFLAKAVAKATGQAHAAAAQPGARPNIQLPPSLHRQTGTAHDPASDDNDMSDAALMRYATAKGGR